MRDDPLLQPYKLKHLTLRNRGELDHAAFVKLKPQTIRTNPAGKFRLYRAGDAVASRNIHAAIYDSLRLCLPL